MWDKKIYTYKIGLGFLYIKVLLDDMLTILILMALNHIPFNKYHMSKKVYVYTIHVQNNNRAIFSLCQKQNTKFY